MSDFNKSLATLSDAILAGIDSRVKELHTSLPGIIESFDAATQTVTIQPAVKRVFKTTDGASTTLIPTALPKLINVPIQYPRGGGFSLTFPIHAGDEGLIIFCERAIDTWHDTGKVSVPNARRFHSLSDATVHVGLSSLTNKVPDYDPDHVVLKSDTNDVYITIKDSADVEVHADNMITTTSGADTSVTSGAAIHITATDNVDIDASANVTINAVGDITATAGGNITATASGSADVIASSASVVAPTIQLTGAVTISGALTVTGLATLGTAAITTLGVSGVLTQAGQDIGKGHKHGNVMSGTSETGAVI